MPEKEKNQKDKHHQQKITECHDPGYNMGKNTVAEHEPTDMGVDVKLHSLLGVNNIYAACKKGNMQMKERKGSKHALVERIHLSSFLWQRGNDRLYFVIAQTENQDNLKQCCFLLLKHMARKQRCYSKPCISHYTYTVLLLYAGIVS